MSDQPARDSPSNVPSQPRLLSPGQFSIASLLLLTLWIAICLAIFRLSPVVGGTLGLWTVPAAIRALYSIQYWRRRLPTLLWGEVYEILGHSLILIAAAAVAACLAFVVASVTSLALAIAIGLRGPPATLAALVISLASGATAAGWVLWLGRPSQFDKPT